MGDTQWHLSLFCDSSSHWLSPGSITPGEPYNIVKFSLSLHLGDFFLWLLTPGSALVHSPSPKERTSPQTQPLLEFVPPEAPPARDQWVPDETESTCMVCCREHFTMVSSVPPQPHSRERKAKCQVVSLSSRSPVPKRTVMFSDNQTYDWIYLWPDLNVFSGSTHVVGILK